MNIITRKIQILVNQEDVQDVFTKLYKWQEITFRAYNYTATHRYIQENLREFFYINDDIKLTLANRAKISNAAFSTSKENTTYQLLSKTFKGDIPTNILSNINRLVTSQFKAEQQDYFSGKRSLRTYKRNVPIPFSKSSMVNFEQCEDATGRINYTFNLFQMSFRTNFGRDRSSNRVMFERALSGEYAFADSSLLLKDNKIFLLATFKFPTDKSIDRNKIAYAKLSFNCPVELNIGKNNYQIGTREGYLHRRLAIQGARSRLQKNLTFSNGGHGQKAKLQKLAIFEKKESNYIETVMHRYSKKIIDLCIKNQCGQLVISANPNEIGSIEAKVKEINADASLNRNEKEDAIEKAKYVISHWSYYSLINKIEYKAKIAGIVVTLQ